MVVWEQLAPGWLRQVSSCYRCARVGARVLVQRVMGGGRSIRLFPLFSFCLPPPRQPPRRPSRGEEKKEQVLCMCKRETRACESCTSEAAKALTSHARHSYRRPSRSSPESGAWVWWLAACLFSCPLRRPPPLSPVTYHILWAIVGQLTRCCVTPCYTRPLSPPTTELPVAILCIDCPGMSRWSWHVRGWDGIQRVLQNRNILCCY